MTVTLAGILYIISGIAGVGAVVLALLCLYAAHMSSAPFQAECAREDARDVMIYGGGLALLLAVLAWCLS